MKFNGSLLKQKIIFMKILKSFAAAFNGIRCCFISETNFKIHVIFAVVTIALGFLLAISATEWLALIFCIAFVITMEMLNTALEKLCDIIHAAIHPVIKKVKDIAAGAVLLSAIASFIIGGIIFLPKIIVFIKTF